MHQLDSNSLCGSVGASVDFSEPVMRRIPEGWFWMGDDAGRDDEQPMHRVWVDAFELAALQVTNADYAHFLAATRHPRPLQWDDASFNHPKQPVVNVSWLDAIAYCEWLTHVTDLRLRLPTEAEWERAARGGIDGQSYPWGDTPPESLPDYSLRWKTGPEQVGRYAPNPYGLFNMGDNVHEWCADWYDAAYYGRSPARNPRGPQQGDRRVSRGGAWRHADPWSQVSHRSSLPPGLRYSDYGVRLAGDA